MKTNYHKSALAIFIVLTALLGCGGDEKTSQSQLSDTYIPVGTSLTERTWYNEDTKTLNKVSKSVYSYRSVFNRRGLSNQQECRGWTIPDKNDLPYKISGMPKAITGAIRLDGQQPLVFTSDKYISGMSGGQAFPAGSQNTAYLYCYKSQPTAPAKPYTPGPFVGTAYKPTGPEWINLGSNRVGTFFSVSSRAPNFKRLTIYNDTNKNPYDSNSHAQISSIGIYTTSNEFFELTTNKKLLPGGHFEIAMPAEYEEGVFIRTIIINATGTAYQFSAWGFKGPKPFVLRPSDTTFTPRPGWVSLDVAKAEGESASMRVNSSKSFKKLSIFNDTNEHPRKDLSATIVEVTIRTADGNRITLNGNRSELASGESVDLNIPSDEAVQIKSIYIEYTGTAYQFRVQAFEDSDDDHTEEDGWSVLESVNTDGKQETTIQHGHPNEKFSKISILHMSNSENLSYVRISELVIKTHQGREIRVDGENLRAWATPADDPDVEDALAYEIEGGPVSVKSIKVKWRRNAEILRFALAK